MLDLTGRQQKQLRVALVEAFATWQDLSTSRCAAEQSLRLSCSLLSLALTTFLFLGCLSLAFASPAALLARG